MKKRREFLHMYLHSATPLRREAFERRVILDAGSGRAGKAFKKRHQTGTDFRRQLYYKHSWVLNGARERLASTWQLNEILMVQKRRGTQIKNDGFFLLFHLLFIPWGQLTETLWNFRKGEAKDILYMLQQSNTNIKSLTKFPPNLQVFQRESMNNKICY